MTRKGFVEWKNLHWGTKVGIVIALILISAAAIWFLSWVSNLVAPFVGTDYWKAGLWEMYG